jgi:hypothetical protein
MFNAVDLYNMHNMKSISTSAPSLEHPKVVLKLTGSISTFGEGSARRAAFVSGLAAVLRISENQIVIVSVTEGSVIVELGFVRLGGVHPSPADVVLRLKSAAASGELEQFGVTELSVGQEAHRVHDEQRDRCRCGCCGGRVCGWRHMRRSACGCRVALAEIHIPGTQLQHARAGVCSLHLISFEGAGTSRPYSRIRQED